MPTTHRRLRPGAEAGTPARGRVPSTSTRCARYQLCRTRTIRDRALRSFLTLTIASGRVAEHSMRIWLRGNGSPRCDPAAGVCAVARGAVRRWLLIVASVLLV